MSDPEKKGFGLICCAVFAVLYMYTAAMTEQSVMIAAAPWAASYIVILSLSD